MAMTMASLYWCMMLVLVLTAFFMSKILIRCVCYSVVLLLSNNVSAEVVEQTHYYSIVASSGQELDTQLSLKSRNGFHADTQWSIQPRYRFNKVNGGCEVSQSIVNLTVTYTMPQWLNKQDASQSLQTKWDDWYQNLYKP